MKNRAFKKWRNKNHAVQVIDIEPTRSFQEMEWINFLKTKIKEKNMKVFQVYKNPKVMNKLLVAGLIITALIALAHFVI